MSSELTTPIIARVTLTRNDLRAAGSAERKIQLRSKANSRREWLALLFLLAGIALFTYWIAGSDRVFQTIVVEVLVVGSFFLIKRSGSMAAFAGEWQYEFAEDGINHQRKHHDWDLMIKLPWSGFAGYTETEKHLILWSPDGGAFILPKHAFANPAEFAQVSELFARHLKRFNLNRKFWQFHLATAILMMFVAGGFVWANTLERGPQVFTFPWEHSAQTWGWPFQVVEQYNWPIDGPPEVVEEMTKTHCSVIGLILNILIGIAITLGAGIVCEWFTRQREAQR